VETMAKLAIWLILVIFNYKQFRFPKKQQRRYKGREKLEEATFDILHEMKYEKGFSSPHKII